MGDKKRSYNCSVVPEDVDMFGTASIGWLVDAILGAARNDADSNGFGVKQLTQQHLTWVVSRLTIRALRYPRPYENIEISTWIHSVGGVKTTRCFELTDQNGETIASAISYWALIDTRSRRPVSLETIGIYQSFVQPFTLPIAPPERLVSQKQMQELEKRQVRYSHVDFNRHLHSTLYLLFVLDTMPIAILEEERMARIDINFLREALLDDQITILSHTDPNNSATTQFDLAVEGDVVCRIAFSHPQQQAKAD